MGRETESGAGFIIRDIKKRDAKDLIKNYYLRYTEVKRNPYLGVGMYKNMPSMKNEMEWFNGLLKQIREGRAVASVAEADGIAVGLCDVTIRVPEFEKSHVGTVGITIREGYRSMGIGTALLGDAIRKAKTRFKMLNLEVFSTNRQAKRLYKKYGFKVYGTLPNGVIRGRIKIDSVFMYRRL